MGTITEGTMYLAAVYALYESGEEVCTYSVGGCDFRGAVALAEGVAQHMALSPSTPSSVIKLYGDVVEIRMDTRKVATIYKVTYDREGKLVDVDYSVENW